MSNNSAKYYRVYQIVISHKTWTNGNFVVRVFHKNDVITILSFYVLKSPIFSDAIIYYPPQVVSLTYRIILFLFLFLLIIIVDGNSLSFYH